MTSKEKVQKQKLIIKNFPTCCDYQNILNRMANFTAMRAYNTLDELWILEHEPIFTLGRAASKNNLLQNTAISIIQTDRGGEITYHGPGQILFYVLLNIKRLHINIKNLVAILEDCIIEVLKKYEITAHKRENMPGVYVDNAKIASIGLKIKNGCSYHGIAFNFNLDLTPFSLINPCGYKNLRMTKFSDFNTQVTKEIIQDDFITVFTARLNYAK